MVAFTPNRLLAQPAVGGDVGVWGPPLNNNQTVLDQILSQAVVINFAAAIVDVAKGMVATKNRNTAQNSR